ncbi:hypothetical protein HY612_05430 [Candidatus Roizmanbacteria bacterium]|nr:hypothetical protein [Candidatus Roizmanbacteria bacterium]
MTERVLRLLSRSELGIEPIEGEAVKVGTTRVLQFLVRQSIAEKLTGLESGGEADRKLSGDLSEASSKDPDFGRKFQEAVYHRLL